MTMGLAFMCVHENMCESPPESEPKVAARRGRHPSLAGTRQLKWLAKRGATAAVKGRGIYAASTWPTVWCAGAAGRAEVEAA